MPLLPFSLALTLPHDWLQALAFCQARIVLLPSLQAWHMPIRLLHLAGMAAFFGSIVLLDLRLLGAAARRLTVDEAAGLALPVTHAAFVVTLVTGTALFLTDPLKVGAHTWFLPKMALLALALANAAAFSLPRAGAPRPAVAGPLTRHARLAGALSIALWSGVIACATANHEEPPRPLALSARN